jgi:inner membrane protein involved in colicin E2 resistance
LRSSFVLPLEIKIIAAETPNRKQRALYDVKVYLVNFALNSYAELYFRATDFELFPAETK